MINSHVWVYNTSPQRKTGSKLLRGFISRLIQTLGQTLTSNTIVWWPCFLKARELRLDTNPLRFRLCSFAERFVEASDSFCTRKLATPHGLQPKCGLKHARGMLTKGERNFLASNFRDRNNSFINLTIGDIIWDSSLRKKKPKDSFWVEGRNAWRESWVLSLTHI